MTASDEILVYAIQRLDNYPTHCYANPQEQKIRIVMRYVGLRMIYLKLLEALRRLRSC